jgi:choline dehydrogenase-like flavoprotein
LLRPEVVNYTGAHNLPSDFEIYDKYNIGRNWPEEVRYAQLEGWICEAEHVLGVSGDDDEYDNLFGAFRSQKFPMPKIVSSYSDDEVSKIINGMIFSKADIDFLENDVELKVTTNPVTRNSMEYDGRKACEGNSSCIPICPSGAKYDASVHLKKAIANGVVLIKKAVVYQINKGENGLIECIKYYNYEKESKEITANYFVLAANAIESAKILLYSDVANSSKMVGKNLMDHLTEEVAAILPFEVYPFRGPQSITTIESFRDGKFREKMSAIRMTIGNDGWGRKESPSKTLNTFVDKGFYGTALKQSVRDRITKQLRISYTTEVLPREYNMITLSSLEKDAFGIPRPLVSFTLDEYNIKAFEYAQKIISKIFTKLQAIEIKLPTNTTSYNGSGHLIGTCIMGDFPQNSVVDKDCRSFDHKNLFIIGASVLPTSATANPTITFTALTLKTAKIISDEVETKS